MDQQTRTFMTEHICRHIQINGSNLCYYSWNETSKNVLLFIHGTGFHARCWDSVAIQLSQEYRVVSVDLRGHGKSGKQPPFTWSTYAEDLVGFLKAVELDNVIGVGHSMGGHCITAACAQLPRRFSGLVLIDPVIFVDELYIHEQEHHSNHEAHYDLISRRRKNWESPEQMFLSLREKPPFSLWLEPILRDYCEHALQRNQYGEYTLACPPDVEANIYLGSRYAHITNEIKTIYQPVTVMRAPAFDLNSSAIDFIKSPTREDLADLFPAGEDRFYPDLTHFIPMQNPELVEDEIYSLVARAKLTL